MTPEQHETVALRIEATLRRLQPDDYEMLIEGAMLAGTHRVNALMHRLQATRPEIDVMHSYLLTVNEFDRLCVAHPTAMGALRVIEKMRPAHVRGNWQGGPQAGRDALAQLQHIRQATTNLQEIPQ